jgi:hypothetical protein
MKYLTLLGCLIFLAASSVQLSAQRATEPPNLEIAAPIKVTALPLNTGKSQTALRKANTWLTQPLVQVENTSTNVIEYLVIQVSFPGAKSDPLMLAYGQAPGYKSSLKVTEPLKPGEKVSLSVSSNVCEELQSRASGIHPSSGSRVNTVINAVVFTNKTAWFDGLLHTADANNPSRWNVVRQNSENVLDIADPNNPSLWNVVTKSSENTGLPLFQFMQANYRPNRCYRRDYTEWKDCCGTLIASAVMSCCYFFTNGSPFEEYFCCDGTYTIMDTHDCL